jgi:hypothetical protein
MKSEARETCTKKSISIKEDNNRKRSQNAIMTEF